MFQELAALVSLDKATLIVLGAAVIGFLWYRLVQHEKLCELRQEGLLASIEVARKDSNEGDLRLEKRLDGIEERLETNDLVVRGIARDLNEMVGYIKGRDQ